MVDSDLALQRVLEYLSPEADASAATPDWTLVGDRLSPRSKRSRRWRFAFAGVLAFAAICLPAIALSASVRGWLGFGVQPVYAKAQLKVSANVPGNRVARLWTSPSTDGGECEIVTVTPASFVVIDPTTGGMRPAAARQRDSGGGACTLGSTHMPADAFTWGFAPIRVGKQRAALIDGHVGRTHKPVRVELAWNGGKQRLRTADGYFIGVVDALDPEFDRLPYTLVAYDAHGDAVARSRIPTSFLYGDWKSVEGRLQEYRQSHGCSKVPARLWDCKTR